MRSMKQKRTPPEAGYNSLLTTTFTPTEFEWKETGGTNINYCDSGTTNTYTLTTANAIQ